MANVREFSILLYAVPHAWREPLKLNPPGQRPLGARLVTRARSRAAAMRAFNAAIGYDSVTASYMKDYGNEMQDGHTPALIGKAEGVVLARSESVRGDVYVSVNLLGR